MSSFSKFREFEKAVQGVGMVLGIFLCVSTTVFLSCLPIRTLMSDSLWFGVMLLIPIITLLAIVYLVKSRSDYKSWFEREKEVSDNQHENWKEETQKLLREISTLKAEAIKKDWDFKAAEEKSEKLLKTERETSEALRNSNVVLNQKFQKLTRGAAAAAYILGNHTATLFKWSASKVSSEGLKSLRWDSLNAAIKIFEGFEDFTWENKDIPAAACRDFVAEQIRYDRIEMTEPWVAKFIRFAHRLEKEQAVE